MAASSSGRTLVHLEIAGRPRTYPDISHDKAGMTYGLYGGGALLASVCKADGNRREAFDRPHVRRSQYHHQEHEGHDDLRDEARPARVSDQVSPVLGGEGTPSIFMTPKCTMSIQLRLSETSPRPWMLAFGKPRTGSLAAPMEAEPSARCRSKNDRND
jgi:hypothetical protein